MRCSNPDRDQLELTFEKRIRREQARMAGRAQERAVDQVENGARQSWMAAAHRVGLYLARSGEAFTSADVRDRLGQLRPELTTRDERALGAVMRRLAKAGEIRPTGQYVASGRARNHHRPMREWRGSGRRQ